MAIRIAVSVLVLAGLACGRVGFERAPKPRLISSERGMVGCSHGIVARPDAGGFFVAWYERLAGATTVEVRGLLLDERGRPAGSPTTLALGDTAPAQLRVAAHATGYWVYGDAASTLDVISVDLAGQRLATVEVQGSQFDALSIVDVGDGAVAVYERNDDIFVAAIDPATGALSNAPAAIDQNTATQVSPSATFANGVLAIAWQDHRAGKRVRTIQTDRAGVAIGASVGVLDTGQDQLEPLVAGDDAVVVHWHEAGRGFSVLAGAGAGATWPAAAPLGFANRNESYDAAIAAGGGRAVVVYESDADELLTQIYAAVTELDASEPAATIELRSDPATLWLCPQVARGATGFMATFVGLRDGTQGLHVDVLEDP